MALSAFESFDWYAFETGECEYFGGWTRPGVKSGFEPEPCVVGPEFHLTWRHRRLSEAGSSAALARFLFDGGWLFLFARFGAVAPLAITPPSAIHYSGHSSLLVSAIS